MKHVACILVFTLLFSSCHYYPTSVYSDSDPEHSYVFVGKELSVPFGKNRTALLVINNANRFVDGGKLTREKSFSKLEGGNPGVILFIIPILLFDAIFIHSWKARMRRKNRKLREIRKLMMRIDPVKLVEDNTLQYFSRVGFPLDSISALKESHVIRKKAAGGWESLEKYLKKHGFSRLLIVRVTGMYLRQYRKDGDFHAVVSLTYTLLDSEKRVELWKVKVKQASRIRGRSLQDLIKKDSVLVQKHFRDACLQAARKGAGGLRQKKTTARDPDTDPDAMEYP